MATNHPNKVRFNDEDYTVTIKDDITWYLTEKLYDRLYGDIRSIFNERSASSMALLHKIR